MPSTFSMRRLVAVSTALFLVILAFLAGRVHAGADPAQVSAPASNAVRSEPAPQLAVPDRGTVPAPGGQDTDPPVTQSS